MMNIAPHRVCFTRNPGAGTARRVAMSRSLSSGSPQLGHFASPCSQSRTWRCQAVGATTYSAITSWLLWHTASRQGAWEMRSETGGDCLNPTMMNHDYTVVNAY